MPRTLVIVWAGAVATQAQHAPELRSWAEARHVTLSPPFVSHETRPPYDAAVADDVERRLLDARAALDALDPEAARDDLAAAAALLERRPIPQAAWLMAEVHLLQAERLSDTDPDAARLHRRQAERLGGPRARSLSQDAPSAPGPVASSAPARLLGLRPGDVPYVDGVPQKALPRGRHHLRVVRGGREVYSRWLTVHGPTVTIVTAAPPPCSDRDLAGAGLESGAAVGAPLATCPVWAMARPTPQGIEVAMCHESHCGPLLPWRASDGETFSGSAQPDHEPGGIPAWLSWTIAGVATATATSLVLWQTGVFDAPTPGSTKFVVVPPKRP
jgi:hypothetical protein